MAKIKRRNDFIQLKDESAFTPISSTYKGEPAPEPVAPAEPEKGFLVSLADRITGSDDSLLAGTKASAVQASSTEAPQPTGFSYDRAIDSLPVTKAQQDADAAANRADRRFTAPVRAGVVESRADRLANLPADLQAKEIQRTGIEGEINQIAAASGSDSTIAPVVKQELDRVDRKLYEQTYLPEPKGLIEPGNINLATRPSVKNKDGSISTVRSMSFNIDGKEVLVPTVSDDGRIMSDDEAVAQYRKTGKHLGIFSNPQDAVTYAKALHDKQEQAYLNGDLQTTNALRSQLYGGAVSDVERAGNKTAQQLQDEMLANYRKPEDVLDVIANSAARTASNTTSMNKGLVALGLDLIGADETALDVLKSAAQSQKTAASFPAAYQNFTKVDSWSAVPVYLLEGVIENTGTLAQAISAAGASSVIAKNLGKEKLQQLTQEAARKEVLKRMAMGSAVGAYLSSTGMEGGSIYSDIYQETGQMRPGVALAFGSVAGALDAIAPFRAVTTAAKQQIVGEVMDTVLKRYGKEAALQLAAESSTEFAQTLIEKSAISFVDGRPVLTRENIIEAADAAIKGGASGAALGVGSQAVGDILGSSADPAEIARRSALNAWNTGGLTGVKFAGQDIAQMSDRALNTAARLASGVKLQAIEAEIQRRTGTTEGDLNVSGANDLPAEMAGSTVATESDLGTGSLGDLSLQPDGRETSGRLDNSAGARNTSSGSDIADQPGSGADPALAMAALEDPVFATQQESSAVQSADGQNQTSLSDLDPETDYAGHIAAVDQVLAQSELATQERTGQTPFRVQPISTEQAQSVAPIVEALSETFGTSVVPFSATESSAPDGFAFNSRTYLNVSNLDKSVAFVAAHEFGHTLETSSDPADRDVAQWLRENLIPLISEEGQREYAEKFLTRGMGPVGKDGKRGALTLEQVNANPDLRFALESEMTQDFLGKRMTDRKFLRDLAKRDPEGFTGFVQKWIAALDNLIASLKGKKDLGVQDIDKYIKNLKQAKELATIALIQAKANARARAAQNTASSSGAASDVRFAKRNQVREKAGAFEFTTAKDGGVTVFGDSAAIRAKLPEDVKGRIVSGGIQFTNSDAPRVKAALAGRSLAYSREGVVVDKLPMRDGKYLGAPEKYNTPGKIGKLRKQLRQLSLEGEPGRFWYENSSKEILRMTGNDVQEARKFVALLAIYSPQAKVDANSTFALRAWAQYKAGQPISIKQEVFDKKAQAAMDNIDKFWSGEKTGNFFNNLLREIDPSTAGKQGATIDMWMMRAAEYETDVPSSTQYAFMENETNRVAKELGWEPQQVQAAIWVAMKARMENPGVKKATEASSEKKKWIRFDTNEAGKKKRVILNAQRHRDNWLKNAMAHDPTKADTAQAKFDFSDGVLRHIGQISFEARPGRTSGVLPGIHSAPYAQQLEFQQAVHKAFYDDNGRDLLAHYLGILVDSDILAPGVWQGEVSPSTQSTVAMAPAAGEAGKSSVDPAQAKLLNVYAAVAGLVAKQEGVGWHRPFYTTAKKNANGLAIELGRSLTPDETQKLEAAVGEWMLANGKTDWQNSFAFISIPKGIRILNFGVVSNGELQSEIVKVAETVLPDFDYRLFASDGNMPSNNWKENPNGESYIQRISAEGRPDVLDWARTILAPRVQRVFNEYSERYNWGDPGQIRFSRKDDAGRNTGTGSPAPQSGSEPVSVIGRHYSTQERSILDGRFFGTGLTGAESDRVMRSPDRRLRSRLYFYVNEGKGVRPEAGVGRFEHTVNLSNLYNTASRTLSWQKDPDGDNAVTANNFETAVLDAGYSGYYRPEAFGTQGVAILLGDAAVNVKTDKAKPVFSRKQVNVQGLGSVALELSDFSFGKDPRAEVSATLTDGSKAGYLSLYKDPNGKVELATIDVKKQYRRKGLATEMVRFAQANVPGIYTKLFTSDGKKFFKALGLSKPGPLPKAGRKTPEPISNLVLSLERVKNKSGWGKHLTADHLRPSPDEKSAAYKAADAERKLNAAFIEAAKAKDAFDTFLKDLANFAGLKAKTAPLKSRARTVEKVIEDYNNNVDMMKDILRGTILTESIAQARQIYELLAENAPVAPVSGALKSSLETPNAAGYADAKVILDVNGVNAEVIIVPEALQRAKDIAHTYYKQQRSLVAESKAIKTQAAADKLIAQAQTLDEKMREIYLPAAQRAQSSSASLRVQGTEFSRELALLSSRLSGSNANLGEYGRRSSSGGSATGMPSKSKNLVPSGKSASGDLAMVSTSESDSIPQGINLRLSRKQTESPEFKKWFGDSKVASANGKPIMVYHGTQNPTLNSFKPNAYFTSSEETASKFADRSIWDQTLIEGEFPNVIPAYIKLENPYIVESYDEYEDEFLDVSVDANKWKAQGYDGMIFDNGKEAYYLVFDPTQIKSAVGNNGNFDPSNPDIRFSRKDLRPTGFEAYAPALVRASKVNSLTDDRARREAIAQLIPVAQTPAALKQVKDLRRNEYVVGTAGTVYLKGTNQHANSNHNAAIPESVLANLPALMADPLAIYNKGAFDKAKPNATSSEPVYLVVLPVKVKGEYVTLAIDPAARYGKTTVNFIKSVHTRAPKTLNLYTKHMVYEGINGRNEKDSEIMLATMSRVSESGALLESGQDLTIRQAKGVDKPRSREDVIRLSRKGPKSGSKFALPEESRSDAFVRNIQNDQLRWKQQIEAVRERGGVVNDQNDVYQAMERMIARAMFRTEDFYEKSVKPTLNDMAKAKISLDELGEYLYALHAKERNAEMKKINPQFAKAGYDDVGGSGMSDKEADDIIAAVSARPDFSDMDKFAKVFRSWSEANLNNLVAGGVLTQQQAADMRNKYPNYVPLQGFDQLDDSVGGSLGSGYSTAKSVVRRAKGRKSRAGNPAQYIIHNVAEGMLALEKSNVGRYLERLVSDNPDPDLWTINQPAKTPVMGTSPVRYEIIYQGQPGGTFETKKQAEQFVQLMNLKGAKINKTGGDPQVTQRDMGYDKEVEVRFIKDGKEVRIQLKDPLLVRAYNNTGTADVGALVRASANINAFFRAMWTQKNPVFPLINVIRDVPSAMLYGTGEQGAGFAAKMALNMPKAWWAMWRMAGGKSAGAMDQWIQDYRKAGGGIGFRMVSDIENTMQRIDRMQQQLGEKTILDALKSGQIATAGKRLLWRSYNNAVLDFVERVNQAFENMSRLAIYKTGIESGLSVAESARMAKNVTVNFNRRGEQTPNVNSLYLFFNAGVQGVAKDYRSVMKSDYKNQVRVALGLMAGVGFAIAAMSDDDEDLNQENTNVTGIRFKVGKSEINIPLPYAALGFSYYAGRSMYKAFKGEDITLTSARLASALLTHLSPINPLPNPDDPSAKDIAVAAVPTPLEFPVQVLLNRSSFGSDMRPDYNNNPDAYKAFRGTRNSVYSDIAQFLNESTGGTKREAGFIDVSPETLKGIVHFALGGSGKFIGDTASTVNNLVDGEVKAASVPIVNRFVKPIDVTQYRSRFYSEAGDAKEKLELYNGYKKDRDTERRKELEAWAKLGRQGNNMWKKMNELRDQEIDIANDKSLSNTARRAKLKEIEDRQIRISNSFHVLYKAKVKQIEK